MSSVSVVDEVYLNTDIYLSVNYIIFIVGIIGNVLIILVFSNLKLFRSNRCAFYLTVESIVNISLLCHICIIQVLIPKYGVAPENSSFIWCKLKNIPNQTLRLFSSSIVCFQAFDQFLSTNPRPYLRQISTIKLAQYLIFTSFCIWIFHSIPFIIFAGIDSVLGCIIFNGALTRYYTFFYYPFLHGSLLILISSLFSLFAYLNVRNLIRLQITVVRRRLDRQLTAMVFLRVIFFVALLLPYTVYRIYMIHGTITSGTNILNDKINQLIYAIVNSMKNADYAISFYVFLFSSSRYRRQVKYFLMKKCWQSLKRWCHSNHNEIYPLDRISNIVSNELG